MVSRSGELFGLLLEYSVGKVFGEDLFGETEDDGVLDRVLEFANVSGPTVACEESAGLA